MNLIVESIIKNISKPEKVYQVYHIDHDKYGTKITYYVTTCKKKLAEKVFRKKLKEYFSERYETEFDNEFLDKKIAEQAYRDKLNEKYGSDIESECESESWDEYMTERYNEMIESAMACGSTRDEFSLDHGSIDIEMAEFDLEYQ